MLALLGLSSLPIRCRCPVAAGHEHQQTTRQAIGDRSCGLSGHAAFETFSVLTRLPPPNRRTPGQWPGHPHLTLPVPISVASGLNALAHCVDVITGTRRPMASAPTPPSRTPTTSPGSSPRPEVPGRTGAPRDVLHRARPVAEQIVKRANKSSREFGQCFEVLGLMAAETEEEMRQQIEERKANTPRSRAKREALVAAMELKDYEFNAHGVDLGQLSESAAIVPDGSERPQPTRDPELYYQPSTVPTSTSAGAR